MASDETLSRSFKTMFQSPFVIKRLNSGLKEINLGNNRPRKKVDINVLEATNCSLKYFKTLRLSSKKSRHTA